MRRVEVFPLLLVLAQVAGCRPHAPARAAPQIQPFLESAERAGIHFQQRTGRKETVDIVQTSAGGCGVLDFDGDGWLDVYLVQGQHQPGPGGGNRLFRNRGDGTFEDVTEHAGVRGHGYGMACATGDFDADGWTDLYVCNYGTNELFRNRGDGTFEEIGGRTGAAVRGCSVGAVFADLTGDGWPDLYVARYVHITARSRRTCELNGVPTSCGPADYEPEPGVFLQSVAGKRFQDRTRQSGLLNHGRAMAVVVGDADGDGRSDLFVANDTTANSLFIRRRNGSYREEALVSGVAYGDMGVSEANMGSDFGDYDGDGRLDLFVGVMQDRMSLLFRNDGAGLFRHSTREAGLGEVSSPVVTFGCGFLDFDNDGDLDIFQANGHVHNRIHDVDPRLHFEQPRQLFENVGRGRFVDRTPDGGPALLQAAAGRGAAFGDLDNDGDIDIVINNLDGRALLLLNQAERLQRHWLRVRLNGRHPNPAAEGAILILKLGERTLLRHLHTTYSYASANDPRVHFGLGALTGPGSLRILWPDGARQEVPVTAVDREIQVTRE